MTESDYDTIFLSVGIEGTDKHPDDGPGRWFKAYLIYGQGKTDHIESVAGSPKEAIDFAFDLWAKKKGRSADGTQAGGTQPPAEGERDESMESKR